MSTIFRNSDLNEVMLNRTIHFPIDSFIIGDDEPYSGCLSTKQRIFNYRLLRARRVVENAFGILSMRFRIFQKPIILKSSSGDMVIKTGCAFYN
ncbi:hypothetical protein HUJ04_000375 [Dendroctonus ponderosae]|nr:hypothetical protein HUJ04_000375 [Dendroctonus ponderosae]